MLLSTSLCKNLWQTGSHKWKVIQTVLRDAFSHDISIRGIKDRIELLPKQFRSQHLQSKTGTEGEKSCRGSLLETIDLIVQEENSAINFVFSADQDELYDRGESVENSEERNIKSKRNVVNSSGTEDINTVDLTNSISVGSVEMNSKSNVCIEEDSDVDVNKDNKDSTESNAKKVRKQRPSLNVKPKHQTLNLK